MHRRPPSDGAGRRAAGRGFTLIELLITLAILGVLAVLVAPVVHIEARRGKEQDLRRALREIRRGIDDYKRAADEGRVVKRAGASGYPPDLETLVRGVPDQRDPSHRKIFFLRRIPRDPMLADAALSDEGTWGLRSYASEASAPEPGADVFDVHSTSSGIGLDGIPYARW